MKNLNSNAKDPKHNDFNLNIYLKEVKEYKLLTDEEVKVIGLKILKGDQEAINKLAIANLRFVIKLAKEYRDYDISINDLISEGNIGLLRAAKKYNVNLGYKFSTYAVWYIRQAMQKTIETNSTIIIPRNKLKTIRKIHRGRKYLEQQLQRLPTTTEIADHIQTNELTVTDCLEHFRTSVSLNELDHNLELKIMNRGFSNEIDIYMEAKSISIIMQLLLRILPKRENQIIAHYYGLGYDKSKDLDEISIIMNLGRERVRQLKDIGLKKLKSRSTIFLNRYGIY